MELTELEKKMVRLALDPAAQPGEIATCALKLVEQWRKRGVTAEEIATVLPRPPPPPPVYSRPDYGLTELHFGKHNGKMLKDVPPDYLRWLAAAREADGHDEDDDHLLFAIRSFLRGN